RGGPPDAPARSRPRTRRRGDLRDGPDGDRRPGPPHREPAQRGPPPARPARRRGPGRARRALGAAARRARRPLVAGALGVPPAPVGPPAVDRRPDRGTRRAGPAGAPGHGRADRPGAVAAGRRALVRGPRRVRRRPHRRRHAPQRRGPARRRRRAAPHGPAHRPVMRAGRFTAGGWLALSLGVLVVAALVAIAAAVVAAHRLGDARARLVDRVDPAQTAALVVQSALINQETGVRGFLLGRREAFLDPYRTGERQANAGLRDLDRRAAVAGTGSLR